MLALSPWNPWHPEVTRVDGVGMPFLVYPVLAGAGAAIGYWMGRTKTDQDGNPIPGPIEIASEKISDGIGKAIVAGAVIGAAYLIFLNESSRRTKLA